MHEYMSSGAERSSANIKALRRLTAVTSAAAVDQCEEMMHKQQNRETGNDSIRVTHVQ